MHTLGDPVVPYWHEPLYRSKVVAQGDTALHTNIPVLRYGHCAFTEDEILAAFALLVYQVTGEAPLSSQESSEDARWFVENQPLPVPCTLEH